METNEQVAYRTLYDQIDDRLRKAPECHSQLDVKAVLGIQIIHAARDIEVISRRGCLAAFNALPSKLWNSLGRNICLLYQHGSTN